MAGLPKAAQGPITRFLQISSAPQNVIYKKENIENYTFLYWKNKHKTSKIDLIMVQLKKKKESNFWYYGKKIFFIRKKKYVQFFLDLCYIILNNYFTYTINLIYDIYIFDFLFIKILKIRFSCFLFYKMFYYVTVLNCSRHLTFYSQID